MRERLGSAWTAFWFAAYPARLLAALRIGVCLLVLYKIGASAMVGTGFSGGSAAAYFANGLYSSYVAWLPPPPYEVFVWLSRLFFVLTFLGLVGLATQPSLLVLSGLFFYLFLLNRLFYSNHFYFLGLSVLLFGLMPCGAAWSCDAWLRMRRTGRRAPAQVTAWAARLLQVTVSLIYLGSAASKTNAVWWSGELLRIYAEAESVVPLAWLGGFNNAPFAWQARAALAAEYFLAVGLWWPATRLAAVAAGVLFHLYMEATMSIGSFSWQMLLMYPLFLAARRPAESSHAD